jgi:hypothetical protein
MRRQASSIKNNMKTQLLTALIFSFSATGNAQEQNTDTSKLKFTPPVIVKDKRVNKDEKDKPVFKPPVIVKDKPARIKEPKLEKPVKFSPPVIVKDEN